MSRLPVVLLVATCCAGSARQPQAPDAGPPATISRIGGDYQRADPGETPEHRLSVQVTDAAGVPVGGIRVRWSFHKGAGTLVPDDAATDSQGKASTTVNLSIHAHDIVEVLAEVPSDSALRTVFFVIIGDPPFGKAPETPDASIIIDHGRFTPSTVTIPMGGRIIWTPLDGEPHLISVQGGQPHVRVLNGNPGSTGDGSFVAVFPDSGTFGYYCNFHYETEGIGVIEVR